MMGRPQDNTGGNDATGRRSRFQFSLRSLLALLALTAWMIGWSGGLGIAAFVALGCLALVEAGCTPGARVLDVLNRVLLAFFVSSLAYGAVGFGLMYGENPTGWFGTDQFLFAPLRAKVDRVEAPNPVRWGNLSPQERADMEIKGRRQNLHLGTLFCAVAAVLAHRVLIGRARTAGYILLWAAISGVIVPLAGCWAGSHYTPFHDTSSPGWLTAAGFENVEFFTVFTVGGWAALAGASIFRNQSTPRERCRGLASPECHRVLTAGGLLPLWLFTVISGTIAVALAPGLGSATGILASLAGGTAAAGLGGLVCLRRLNDPLTIAGGWAGLVAALLGVRLIYSPVPAAFVGAIAGALVVLTAWLSEKQATKDPAGTIAIFGLASALGILVMAFISNPAAPRPGAWVYSFQPVQLLGLAVLFAWTTLASGMVYWVIRLRLMLAEKVSGSTREPEPAMDPPNRE